MIGNYNLIVYHNLDHSPAAIDINLPTLVRKVVDHLIWKIEHPRSSAGSASLSPQPSVPHRAEESFSDPLIGLPEHHTKSHP